MSATLLIPVAWTFSTVQSGASQASLAAANQFLVAAGAKTSQDPAIKPGDANPFIAKLYDFALGGESFNRSFDPAPLHGIVNTQYIDMNYLPLIVGIGGDIEGMPMFWEVDDLQALTPPGLPGSVKQDENGDDVQKTWSEWGSPGHVWTLLGGKSYRAVSWAGDGQYMPVSDWLAWWQSPTVGVRLLTQSEYLAVQAANQ